MKGNQVGGTLCASAEMSLHMTGKYPEWWPGRVYDRPVTIWIGQESAELQREITQPALLGTETVDRRHPDFGTGWIPGDLIKKVTKRLAGVVDVADQILVKHVSGRLSRVVLKQYEQGVLKYTGKSIDIWWPDELCPDDIYHEGMTRTQAKSDGMVLTTFTPLKGRTQVVKRYLDPEEGAAPRPVTMMEIYDAVGGVWPEGTPWAGQEWKGHYTKEQADKIIQNYPAYLRKTKAFGVPMAGIGLVFPIDEEEYKVSPFPRPHHWRVICGIDFGINHDGAAAWMWHDRGADIWYLADCYKKAGETIPYHAAAIKARDPMTAGRPRGWIPVAWPHDGLNTEKSSGLTLSDFYWRNGVNMMPESARYNDDKGGRQDVEPILLELLERMQTGRFKVFSTCVDFFEEVRLYHRKIMADEQTKIVPITDDVISAVRAACMMIRYAIPEPGPVVRRKYVGRKVMARG